MHILSHSQPAHPKRKNQDAIETRRIANARLLALQKRSSTGALFDDWSAILVSF